MIGSLIGLLRKVVQAVAAWLLAAVVLSRVWPAALRLPQLWMLVAVSVLANLLQPSHSLFEGSRTKHDRGTATQIVWTVYLTQIAALVELVLRARTAISLDLFTWTMFAVMVAGLGLRTWSVLTLGRFFTWNIDVQPSQRIVRDGPYRVIRHPSYAGALCTFVASCLLLRSWIAALLALIALVAAFQRRIRYEERLLLEAFPEYADYAARTGALFPKLTR